MGRPGRWTAVQLEASIEAVVAGAGYETTEPLTGVPQSSVRDDPPRAARRLGAPPSAPRSPAHPDTDRRDVVSPAESSPEKG